MKMYNLIQNFQHILGNIFFSVVVAVANYGYRFRDTVETAHEEHTGAVFFVLCVQQQNINMCDTNAMNILSSSEVGTVPAIAKRSWPHTKSHITSLTYIIDIYLYSVYVVSCTEGVMAVQFCNCHTPSGCMHVPPYAKAKHLNCGKS